ncbi:MAG: multifunctional CCA tRNA nucleotidyl transferase/2'3'-cyclic phosphodiesterase/2'nucleotidase/phosphatase, partial [Sinobacteraceae bacterium]|nr:multifunctional CCA tRNA nucleotidyl transferase/2'3'-cyclic phosphodiesterase/2'nucleotidase/phosphatase [Nevskiaceae bacterium]
LVESFCQRLRVPKVHRELALAVTRDHLNVHRARELRPKTLLALLERLRGLRKGEFFLHALDACRCDALGRDGHADDAYPQRAYLQQAAQVASEITVRDLPGDLEGAAIGEALAKARVARLTDWKRGQPLS